MAGPNDQTSTGAVIRVSVTPNGGQTSGGSDPVFSGDGTQVIFVGAGDLVPGGSASATTVFAKNLSTGALTALTSSTGGAVNRPTLSQDGKTLAYYAGDNATGGIYVKNLDTGVVTKVIDETSKGGVVSESGPEQNAALSADGSKLAFSFLNLATSKIEMDVADLRTGVIAVVYAATSSKALFNTPQFSSDGNKIAFYSPDPLVSGDTNGGVDLFVKDINTGAITRVSTTSTGAQQVPGHYEIGSAASGSRSSAFLPDGKSIIFESSATNLAANAPDSIMELYLKDLGSGKVTLVSAAADGIPADRDSSIVDVSHDGSKILFASRATNLVAGPHDEKLRLYVKDLQTGAVTAVETSAAGTPADLSTPATISDNPLHAKFSPDGLEVVFSTAANNLVAGDTNERQDVYIKVLTAAHTAADHYTASYAAPFSVDAAHGLLANDVGAKGAGALVVTSFSDAHHGRVDLNPDGSFTYTPDGAFVGTDSFTYRAGVGQQSGAETNVSIDVIGNIRRVDTQADGSQAHDGVFLQTPVLSSDGKYVAVVTHSSDLAANPYAAASQIVLKNLATGVLTIASGPSGGDSPVFSPDGTKVAFSSGDRDIVVRDIASGQSTVVSTLAGGAAGVGASFNPVFSPDGGSILFRSASAQLTNNFAGDLFVKNLATGAITRVSTAADGTPANGQLVGGSVPGYSFSSDGHWIVFASSADNLVAGDNNHNDDIFIKNLQTGQVIRVSTAADGAQSNGNSETPVFSPDGKSVAFQSGAENLVAGDTNKAPDIFIKNLETGEITRVSTGPNGEQATETATAVSGNPVFSPDGTRIAFVSAATNLVPGAGVTPGVNGTIYEKNLVTGAIRLVSSDSFGADGNGFSTNPAYSADGKTISFASYAANLVPGDTNGVGDIFIKDLTKAPYDPSHPVDVAPILVSRAPADGMTNVAPTANVTLTFDKAVHAGHGAITVTGEAGDVRTIDVGDTAQVTFSGATMTLNPATDLAAGKTYHVTFGAGVVVDAAGTAFAGLPNGALDFTTAARPADLQGKVVDGYLAGATVFLDANNDHALNTGEASTITDGQGNYTLPAGSGSLVAIGGSDIATGLPFEGFLSAPSGASVITPLTTLVQLLTQGGVADPVGSVLQALGLPAGVDLLHTDPVAANAGGDATGFALLAAGVTVISDIALIRASLEGQANASVTSATASAYSTLTHAITGASNLDLTKASVLGNIVSLAGVTGDAADRLVAALSSTNQQIKAASTQAALTTAQTHAQGAAANALATPAAPAVSLAHDTGTSASDHITSDAALTVTPSETGGTITYTIDGVDGTHYDPTTLAQGSHTIAVTQTNASGHVSAATSVSFTYDAVAPDLRVDSPTGEVVTDQPVRLTGSLGVGGAGLIVQFMEGASVIGSAQADSSGAWHADFTLHGAGDHTLSGVTTDLAGNTGRISLTIAVSSEGLPPPPPPPPVTTTVDGVQVQTTTITNDDGSTSSQVVVPVVAAGRPDQSGNPAVADIPVTASGASGAVIQVPVGVGMTISGPSTVHTAGQALTDLIRETNAHLPAGANDKSLFVGAGANWLSDLPSSTPVVVRSITPTSGGTQSGEINLLGTTNQVEALVIDVNHMPSSTALTLNNIEYAVIVGAATVTGGEGANVVFGDSASQYIVLGPEDDVLHGGGGDDTVGSKGGNDKLYGDDGNDMLFGGAGDDLLDGGAGQDVALMAGVKADYYFAHNAHGLLASSFDGDDTIVSIETLKMADGQLVTDLAKLVVGTTSVAVMTYQFFTGKTPTGAGLEYLLHAPDNVNPTDLSDAYYQKFNVENRYINFAVSLTSAKGEAHAWFASAYGALTMEETVAKAYSEIFGSTPTAQKIDLLLHADIGGGMTRQAYFDQFAGSIEGGKAALIGWLLAEAVIEDTGRYAKANDAFLADFSDGDAKLHVDLVAVYGDGHAWSGLG